MIYSVLDDKVTFTVFHISFCQNTVNVEVYECRRFFDRKTRRTLTKIPVIVDTYRAKTKTTQRIVDQLTKNIVDCAVNILKSKKNCETSTFSIWTRKGDFRRELNLRINHDYAGILEIWSR